jgi:hypothetical protein
MDSDMAIVEALTSWLEYCMKINDNFLLLILFHLRNSFSFYISVSEV